MGHPGGPEPRSSPSSTERSQDADPGAGAPGEEGTPDRTLPQARAALRRARASRGASAGQRDSGKRGVAAA